MQRVGPDLKMGSLKLILIWNLKIWSKTILIEPDLIFSWLIRLMSRPEIGFRQFFKVKRNRQLCIHVLKKRSHIQLQRNISKNHSFKVSYSHHQGPSNTLIWFVLSLFKVRFRPLKVWECIWFMCALHYMRK